MKALVRDVGPHTWRLRARRAGAAGLLLAFCAVALTPALHAQRGRRSHQELVAALAGRSVMIDKDSHARRPITPEEADVLVAGITVMTAPAAATAAAQVLARGGTMLRTSEHGAGHVVVSRPNEDGSVSTRCVTSADEAVAFLAGELDDAWPVQ